MGFHKRDREGQQDGQPPTDALIEYQQWGIRFDWNRRATAETRTHIWDPTEAMARARLANEIATHPDLEPVLILRWVSEEVVDG